MRKNWNVSSIRNLVNIASDLMQKLKPGRQHVGMARRVWETNLFSVEFTYMQCNDESKSRSASANVPAVSAIQTCFLRESGSCDNG